VKDLDNMLRQAGSGMPTEPGAVVGVAAPANWSEGGVRRVRPGGSLSNGGLSLGAISWLCLWYNKEN